MSEPAITRHFVTVGGNRQVHYRRAGSGPPILVLHQSPASSREMIPTMRLLADRFTVIAPDTPGNGQSDPLPLDCPAMEDFADALVALLDALGLHEPVPIYGYHTGGVCALSLAGRHPRRVSRAMMNGYIQLDEAERAMFLDHYLPAFVPDWSGAHLTWAWSRFRDQYLFFPWFRRDAAHRLRTSLPGADYIQAAIMDLMRAGDAYRGPYRTAFSLDTERALEAVRAPLTILSADTDLLAPYLDRMPPLPAFVTVERCPDPLATMRRAVDLLAAEASPAPSPDLGETAPVEGRLWSRFVAAGGAQSLVRLCREGEGRPLVLIHELSQSSASIERYAAPLAGRRPVIAVDLVGNGESDWPEGAEGPVLAAQARVLAAVLRELGVGPVDLAAEGAGCVVATELARMEPALAASLSFVAPRVPGHRGGAEEVEREAAPIVADIAGGHWLQAWHALRDRAIFSPPQARRREDSLRVEPDDLDPALLHVQTLDRFKAEAIHGDAVRAAAAYPLEAALAGTQCPLRIVDDRHGFADLAARAVGERLRPAIAAHGNRAVCAALLEPIA